MHAVGELTVATFSDRSQLVVSERSAQGLNMFTATNSLPPLTPNCRNADRSCITEAVTRRLYSLLK